MSALTGLNTPAAVIDVPLMRRNIARMQSKMDTMHVHFRPHIKTSKSVPVTAMQLAAGARGITVSTLLEAERFFEAGITDILYAVGMVGSKLPQAMALRRRGCDLKIITDSLASAEIIVRFGAENDMRFEVWIEIDSDGHRSGIRPDRDVLLDVGRLLHEGGMLLGGVMTHAGASYELDAPEQLTAMAEQERKACV
ncbi:MAG TPA: alanine racemase, partial [Duganella sp.]|nr:alanine racemase [Duganella sp.]